MSQNLNERPCRLEPLPWRSIDGHAVLLQPAAGLVHELNETASWLWEQASGERTVAAIAAELATEFDISAEQALEDANELFSALAGLGLLSFKPAAEDQA